VSFEVGRTYVSQIERGIANPSLLIIQQLADSLDLDVHVKLTARRP
jgi:transcriptional regulator with XRE-family HTH domain